MIRIGADQGWQLPDDTGSAGGGGGAFLFLLAVAVAFFAFNWWIETRGKGRDDIRGSRASEGSSAERPATPAPAQPPAPRVVHGFEAPRPSDGPSVHEQFARHVLDWSDGLLTDDELFEFIDQYRKDTGQN